MYENQMFPPTML